MGFRIVEGTPRLRWVPVEPAEVIYMGSIVGVDVATPLEGVRPIPVAAGASNTTNKDIPLGVVVGFNATSANRALSSTYNAEYATQVAAGTPHGSTTSYTGVEGPWAKGDKQLMVQIAEITPDTVLQGPLFNAAVGTAPTVGTVSTGCGGDGIGCTTGAVDVATIANFSTIYMRSGANKGIYRTLTSNSTTAHTWLKAMPATIAVGDTAVAINGLRPYGLSRMQLDSEAQYIDINAALSADYFLIDVVELDLSEAGNEHVKFRFNMDNFCAARA
jgi:hypothetical protein